tara:strand:- start:637 stop:1143 length:507 start_codon:yes stop_codon:yes gene_type:complete
MELATERTCEEQVEQHMNSRLEDLRLMLNPTKDDAELIIDEWVDCVPFRFSEAEGTTAAEIFNEFEEEIREELRERFDEYALSLDVVHADDPGESYARYQISAGGPAEEIRFFCDFNRKPFKVEFWFLDWFDGASRDCTHRPEIELLIDALGFDDWLADHDEFWRDEA